MGEGLYKKYLKNIKEGKTAIKKEYVDKGYFNYYTKKEINNIKDSKKILIDEINSFYNIYIDDLFNKIEIKRGQKPITKNDIKLIPKLLMNSELIVYLGINKKVHPQTEKCLSPLLYVRNASWVLNLLKAYHIINKCQI